jgi:hypothetical protein
VDDVEFAVDDVEFAVDDVEFALQAIALALNGIEFFLVMVALLIEHLDDECRDRQALMGESCHNARYQAQRRTVAPGTTLPARARCLSTRSARSASGSTRRARRKSGRGRSSTTFTSFVSERKVHHRHSMQFCISSPDVSLLKCLLFFSHFSLLLTKLVKNLEV